MKNCLKTELKTIMHLKVIWFVFAVFLILASLIIVNNYSSVDIKINNISSIMDVLSSQQKASHSTIDPNTFTNMEKSINDIYDVYHPSMIINNLSALLLGLGVIFIPILAVLYIGSDYGRSRVIKEKITYYTLGRTIFCKILVTLLMNVFIVIITFIAGYMYCQLKWATSIQHSFDPIKRKFTELSNLNLTLTPSVPHNYEMIMLVFTVLIFYSFLTALIVIISKSSTVGLLSVIALGYINPTLNFWPHSMFTDLITKYLFQNQASIFQYNSSTNPLSTESEVLLLIAYFVIIVGGLAFLSKRQKN